VDGEGREGAGVGAAALDGAQQRGLLAADVRALADDQLNVKIVAQPAGGVGLVDGALHGAVGADILGPKVDDRLAGVSGAGGGV
jgi:hypothetical protein